MVSLIDQLQLTITVGICIVRWGKKKQKTLSLILFKSTELLVIGNTTIRWGLHRVIRGYIVYE